MALAMRASVQELSELWRRRGLDVDLSVGIDLGYARLGTIGFEGKYEYGAVGSVVHVASSLCDAAGPRQVLTSQRIVSDLRDEVGVRSLGGLLRPVHVYEAAHLRAENGTDKGDASSSGPLSAREREVLALIARGLPAGSTSAQRHSS